jgi:hypothetical protein
MGKSSDTDSAMSGPASDGKDIDPTSNFIGDGVGPLSPFDYDQFEENDSLGMSEQDLHSLNANNDVLTSSGLHTSDSPVESPQRFAGKKRKRDSEGSCSDDPHDTDNKVTENNSSSASSSSSSLEIAANKRNQNRADLGEKGDVEETNGEREVGKSLEGEAQTAPPGAKRRREGETTNASMLK